MRWTPTPKTKSFAEEMRDKLMEKDCRTVKRDMQPVLFHSFDLRSILTTTSTLNTTSTPTTSHDSHSVYIVFLTVANVSDNSDHNVVTKVARLS